MLKIGRGSASSVYTAYYYDTLRPSPRPWTDSLVPGNALQVDNAIGEKPLSLLVEHTWLSVRSSGIRPRGRLPYIPQQLFEDVPSYGKTAWKDLKHGGRGNIGGKEGPGVVWLSLKSKRNQEERLERGLSQ